MLLTDTQIQNLHFLLQPYYVSLKSDWSKEWPDWLDESYYSWISLAYKGDDKFHGYAGGFRTDNDDDGFFRFYDDIPAYDFYCCPNGFKHWTSRAKNSLMHLQTIVIDIDAHDSNLSISELQEHIKNFVPKLLENVFFTPNFVSYTGRGVHFWYCIEPCHIAFIESFERCISGLISCYKAAMDKIGDSVLSLDERASKRVSGLFRLPYSYNSKTQTWAEGEMLHTDRIHVNTLHGALMALGFLKITYDYKEDPKKETKKAKKTKRKKTTKKPGFKYRKAGQYRGAFIHRKAFVEHLLDTREDLLGSRNTLLFALCHAVYNLAADFEEYSNYIKYVNSTLPDPLTDSEIEATIKSVYNHNYKYTNEKFLELCGATPKEIKYFNRSTEKKIKKAAASKKKLERDAKVFELWDAGETNISYIAKTVGCARNTVYSLVSQVRF